jgi:hypothetical protein
MEAVVNFRAPHGLCDGLENKRMRGLACRLRHRRQHNRATKQKDKSLLLLFFRKEESSFLKERSKELLPKKGRPLRTALVSQAT